MLQQNWPDLCIAKVWDRQGIVTINAFFFLWTVLSLLSENEGVFLNLGEKWESLPVYRCLSFSQNTDESTFLGFHVDMLHVAEPW